MQIGNMYIVNEANDIAKDRELNERETEILSTIIQLYILNATPIGFQKFIKVFRR